MRRILIVIDMQNDFIDGSLGTKEAVGIVEAVKKKILGYDKKDIFATMDTHKENYLDTQEGKNLPVSHCIEHTSGWELNKEIAPLIDPPNNLRFSFARSFISSSLNDFDTLAISS